MKKSFKNYALIWGIFLVAFNLVVFLVRPVIPGSSIQYDMRFWIAWGFIMLAFAGNLFCAYKAFKADNMQKLFYNLPLITISWSALIAMMIAGCILMLIPRCPAWIAAIVCVLVLAFNAIAVIKGTWAAEAVSQIDEKVRERTSFIKNLTGEAEMLMSRAKSEAVRAECKKVYEAVRYSDPMSVPEVSESENKLTAKTDELKNAIDSDDYTKVKGIVDEIIILVNDRNKIVKELK